MEQYTKIYSEVTELTYKVEATDIKLVCVVKKHNSEFLWSVCLDQWNHFSNRYDVEFFSTTAHSLERCIDNMEFFINKNFKVK